MLNIMREIKDRLWLKVFLFAVAASMVAFLATDVIDIVRTGSVAGGSWAAIVDDEPIPEIDLRRMAAFIDRDSRERFGASYSQLRPSLAIGAQATQRLVHDLIVRQEARRIGLSVSDDEYLDRIRTTLVDPNGEFIGRDQVQRFARQNFGSVQAYEDVTRNEMLIEKWWGIVTDPVFVSERELEDAYRARTEKASIRYVLVRSADQTESTSVSEADLAEWYAAHTDDYMREEARSVRYVFLSRQRFMDDVRIDDAAIVAEYEANEDRYRVQEARRARHILWKVPADATEQERDAARRIAEQTLERIRGGEDFATLARALSQDSSGQDGGDLGWFSRGRMVPEFEQAVWSTAKGELAPLTQTVHGYHVIEVTDAREEGLRPLDEVRDGIRRELATREAQNLLRAEADRLAAEIDSADALATVAEREGLEVVSTRITENDQMPELGPTPAFRDTVQAMQAGEVSEPLVASRGLAIVAVDEVLPPAPAPLEEVRERVKTAVLNDRQQTAAVRRAETALGGGDLDRAAASLDLEVQESDDLAPGAASLPGAGGASKDLGDALFAEGVVAGDTGVVRVPAGAVAYEVTRRIEFDAELFEDSRETLSRELRARKQNEMRSAIYAELVASKDVRYNEDLIARFN